MQQTARFHLTYVAIALFGVMLLHDLWSSYREVAVLPYSTFEQLVDEGKVHKVVVEADRIRGELEEPIDGKHLFVTNRVDPELARRLEGEGIEFSGAIEDRLLPTLLSWIVPVLFFFEHLPISDNADYHTWRDTLDKLDYDKMTRTARLVFNSAWLLANDDERPPKPRE